MFLFGILQRLNGSDIAPISVVLETLVVPVQELSSGRSESQKISAEDLEERRFTDAFLSMR